MLLIFLVIAVLTITIYYINKWGVADGILVFAYSLVVSMCILVITYAIQMLINPVHTEEYPESKAIFYMSTGTYQVDTGSESITVDVEDAYPTQSETTTLYKNTRKDRIIYPWEVAPIWETARLEYNPEELDIRP